MSTPVPAVGPAGVEDVVAALLSLNAEDVPYEVTAEPTDKGAVVTATWKGWDVRWQSFFGAGAVTKTFRLVVTLDGRRGTYAFTELHGSTRRAVGVSAGAVHAEARKDGFRGKTFGARSLKVVVAPRVTVSGERGYEVSNVATLSFTPSTIKVPVFSTLRSLGWRPRFDNGFMRRFEG
ncbi:hypothetical protein [Oerskovia merdavium]|uniref:Uncharacterized protein n=1 Tax=Oerskovia merdavium TaxID=2762227 RepID=A0ABR8U150_9CELL|nr:hypothetical protein [Oerskovia merdavium]MBD7981744.1 hypothetical protein [Oerskovia merdavium]